MKPNTRTVNEHRWTSNNELGPGYFTICGEIASRRRTPFPGLAAARTQQTRGKVFGRVRTELENYLSGGAFRLRNAWLTCLVPAGVVV